MAKLTSVSVKTVPDYINVGDDVNDLTIVTEIEFHPIDINLKMAYLLHILVYDIHGTKDVPIIINNWDDSKVIGLEQDGKDDFLGRKFVNISALTNNMVFETAIALKLGNISNSQSIYKRKLQVLATLVPAIGRSTKWSEPFESKLIF